MEQLSLHCYYTGYDNENVTLRILKYDTFYIYLYAFTYMRQPYDLVHEEIINLTEAVREHKTPTNICHLEIFFLNRIICTACIV